MGTRTFSRRHRCALLGDLRRMGRHCPWLRPTKTRWPNRTEWLTWWKHQHTCYHFERPRYLTQRIEGLKAGADDYLTKPFEMPELIARSAQLRRASGNASPVMQIGNLSLDTRSSSHVARTSNFLNRSRVQSCRLLYANPEKVISRTELVSIFTNKTLTATPIP